MKSQRILKLIAFLLLQIVLTRIKNVSAQEICSKEGLECEYSSKVKFCELPEPIPLDNYGDIITFKMNNYIRLTKIFTTQLKYNENAYVSGLYDEDKKEFKIFATDTFKNYTMKETRSDFILEAHFTCFHDQRAFEFESIYRFNVKISETNLYPPKFSQEEYEKQVSLPFIKGFECIFSKIITATDLDIIYNKVTFSSDNEYLEISTETETADNGHTYFAAISLKKPITEINETFVIEIEAKDNGNPPLSSKAILKLTADKKKSLPIQPRFSNVIYEGNLTKPDELQINAELDMATYDETIVFYPAERDSELFVINVESNKINIRLKDNAIDDEYIKDKSFLSFILNAKNPELLYPGQTAVIVGLPKKFDEITKIYFEKDLYRGKVNKENELEVEIIKFIDESNNGNVKYEFEIQGDDMNLFDYELMPNQRELSLILKDDANWDGKFYLHISILSKLDEVIKASTNVIIDVPIIKSDFRFEKPLFEGQINQTNQLEKLQIKFVNKENLNEIYFQILNENSNYFIIEIFEDFAEIKLKESELPIEWSKKKFLSFQVEARKHGYDAIFTGILINLPTKLQLPQFEEILYKGKIISKKEIEELEIPVHNLGSRFGLSGHNSFTIDQRDGIIKIMLNGELSDEDLELNYIALTLTAIFDESDGSKSSTTIILATPEISLPSTTESTTKSTTESSTTTTEAPEPEKAPVFEKNTYRFSIKADFIGTFGAVKAVFDKDPSSIIEYSTADVEDDLLSRLLLYEDGSLGVSAPTPPGTYIFEVRAKIIGNHQYGSTFVILDISPINVCDGDGSRVENALLIKHLEEERPHKGIIKTVLGNCHYKIMSISPNDKEYFIINGNDLDLISVDREDPIFSGMLLVQIQVKLTLFDNSIPIRKTSTTAAERFTETSSTSESTTDFDKIEDITKLIFKTTTHFNNIKTTESTSEPPLFSSTENIELTSQQVVETDSTEIININSIPPTESITTENIHTTSKSPAEIDKIEDITKLIFESSTNNIKNTESTFESPIVLNSTENIESTSEQIVELHSTANIEFISQSTVEVNTANNMENAEAIHESTEKIESSSKSIAKISAKNIKLPTKNYYRNFSNISLIRPQPRKLTQFNDGKAYILTENIKSSLIETVLTIIIEDINDNKPIFEYPPPNTEFVIGYPDADVSNNILPEYLLKVNATDLDIGLNALIRYKLENSDFRIDEITGIIYPYSHAMKNSDKIKLLVYAVDRKGEIKGSLNSSVEIIVKKIHTYEMIMLEFQGYEFKNVDTLLSEISKNKGFILKPLKWATVPSLTKNDKRSLLHRMVDRISKIFRDDNNQKITLKVWAYAFDKYDAIVKSDTIIEKLSGNSNVIAESYENTVKSDEAISDVTGFIIGIVILSIICVGCIGFIAWIFYFRKILYDKMSSTSRSEASSFAASSETNSTENIKESDSPPQISNYVKRENKKMKIAGTTTQETSDYQTRMLELLNDEDDEDGNVPNGDISGNIPNGAGERRKSVVKFNELVERIEIEDRRDSQVSGVSSERL